MYKSAAGSAKPNNTYKKVKNNCVAESTISLMENYMKEKKNVAMRKVVVKEIQLEPENLTAPRKEKEEKK